MFKNYIKSAVRNLYKNRLFATISLVGLTLAIGCFAVTFVFIDTMNNIDSYHDNADCIYYANIMIERDGDTQLWGPTPDPLGPAMIQDIPQVDFSTRIRNRTGKVLAGGKEFNEHLAFADPDYLNIFKFEMIDGDKSEFGAPNTILINQEVARKFFPSKNPVGESMILRNTNGFEDEFTVGGVMEQAPKGASIQFGVLIAYQRIEDWEGKDLEDWSSWTHTFIKVANPADIDLIKIQLQPYVELQNAASEDWKIQRIVFEEMKNIVAKSGNLRNSINNGPVASSKIAMFFFGFSLVLMACLNYVNIGIVTSTRRLKEIGIRKVLGSNRARLITQFISENILLCLIGLVLGGLLAGQFLIPAFNRMFGAPLKLDLLHNIRLWGFFAGTLFVTAFVSGGYPAIFVSKFGPADILRKNERVGGGSKLTRFFLGMQIFLAFMMLTAGIVFVQNSRFHKRMDWGYNQDAVLTVPIVNQALYEPYLNAVRQHSDIVELSDSFDHVATRNNVDVVEYEGKTIEVDRLAVGYNYLNTLQLRLKKGRNFNLANSTDQDQAVIVTEHTVKRLQLEQPLGTRLTIGANDFFIIGVVENFFNTVFQEPMKPLLFRMSSPDNIRYLSVQVKTGTENSSFDFLKNTWDEMNHEQAFRGFYQNRVWDWYFKDAKGVNELSLFVGFSALLIACMGLFGMISINILKRIKEVSIRKVLGATPRQIVQMLNRDLLILVGISLALAIPCSFLLMRTYLASAFQGTHVPLTAVPFALSGSILIMTILLTVGSQLIKAARTNVVNNLKVE